MPENPRTRCPKCEGTGYVLDFRAIGHDMRQLRTTRRISLDVLATQLRITKSYLHDMELGRRPYRLQHRTRAKQVLKGS